MDKYQLKVINQIFGDKLDYRASDDIVVYSTNIIDGNINIKQIGIKKGYKLCLTNNICIKKVGIYKNEKWEEVERDFAGNISIDFDYKPEKLKIVLFNDIVDDLVFNFVYDIKTEDEINSILEKERIEKLKKSLNVSIRVGENLVNVMFQPCCENAYSTVIYLYMVNNNEKQLMAKYKVEDGLLFKSINGLAYGNYLVIVEQYDANGKLIIESDKKSFSIDPKIINVHSPEHFVRG